MSYMYCLFEGALVVSCCTVESIESIPPHSRSSLTHEAENHVHYKSKSPLYDHAGLERQFSTIRVTYGLLRAILGVEKAGTLAYCNSSLHNDCLETLGVLSGIFYKC